MVTEPESVDQLVYFTNRTVFGKGHVKAWVYKAICPKCKKERMGKPVGKDGKVKIRAKEYVCPACKYTVEKGEFEDTLNCEIKYTCPKCSKTGEAVVPFKRKKVKVFDEEAGKEVSGDAIKFTCGSCKADIAIIKKMKA